MKLQRILTLCMCGLALFSASGALSQSVDEPISDALNAHLASLREVTSSLRQLEPLRDVPNRFPNRDELREKYAELLADPETSANMVRAERFYHAFGLIEPELDLRALLTEVYTSQVAGYYDSEEDYMTVIMGEAGLASQAEQLGFLEQIIYVHEFVHALQDQHYDLTAYLEAAQGSSFDEQLARLALVEGDASLVMNVYTQRIAQANPIGALLGLARAGAENPALIIPPDAPAIITRELLFPYEQGALFVTRLLQDGSWDAVEAAFSAPPSTSEQVLHPDKYLAGETAQAIELTDFSAALGAGWVLVDSGRLGEFYLREWLRTHLPLSEAQASAQGWGGDLYQLYEQAEQRLVVQRLTFDTAEDSAEARASLSALAQAVTQASPTAISESVTCYTGTSETWCLRLGETIDLARGDSIELAQQALVQMEGA